MKISIKKSNVAGKIPATGDLEPGELAVNLADGKLFVGDIAKVTKELTGTGSSTPERGGVIYDKTVNYVNGDVVGHKEAPGTMTTWICIDDTTGDFDAAKWNEISGGIPKGGTTGQTLTKADATDGNAVWTTPSEVTVEDNLTSTSKDNALSAKQGKTLKDLIDASGSDAPHQEFAESKSYVIGDIVTAKSLQGGVEGQFVTNIYIAKADKATNANWEENDWERIVSATAPTVSSDPGNIAIISPNDLQVFVPAADLTDVVKSTPVGNEIQVTNIVSITQADYDAIATKDASKLYIIVPA